MYRTPDGLRSLKDENRKLGPTCWSRAQAPRIDRGSADVLANDLGVGPLQDHLMKQGGVPRSLFGIVKEPVEQRRRLRS